MTAVRSSSLPSRRIKAAESAEDTDLVGAIGLCAGRCWQNADVPVHAAGRSSEGRGVTVYARFPRSDEISPAQRRFPAVFRQRLSQYPALPCVAAGEFVSAAVRYRPFAPSFAFAVADTFLRLCLLPFRADISTLQGSPNVAGRWFALLPPEDAAQTLYHPGTRAAQPVTPKRSRQRPAVWPCGAWHLRPRLDRLRRPASR
jgi:hypothetical protein